ncbi:hypothetical protein [Okeania sp. SIO2B3]|uniref:hypothetical protein n=1 Tax=Okeania sp. SIO2B3 TaxID=2607784 RepID=UPI0013C0E551|nr:hypothetical protein [Okeania sp. SIO2B3]NET41312.1 hypothetical protein [Okeania sp. SIO2B3]NET41313.1 hypothetical protein [Okeania sp. SIO2B3]
MIFSICPTIKFPTTKKFNVESYPPIKKLLPQKLRDFFRAEIHNYKSDLQMKFNWETRDRLDDSELGEKFR